MYTPPLSNAAEAVGPADTEAATDTVRRKNIYDTRTGRGSSKVWLPGVPLQIKIVRLLRETSVRTLKIPANAKHYVLVHLLKLPETPNDPFTRSQSTPDDQ